MAVSADLSWLTTSLDMGRTSPAALPTASMAGMNGVHQGKRCPQTGHKHAARTVWLTAKGCFWCWASRHSVCRCAEAATLVTRPSECPSNAKLA